ncbi:19518_t:CDS:2, partial [Cetraspora pellucida]
NSSQCEFATCNKCSERIKNKRQEKKIITSINQKTTQSSSNITDTSSVSSDLQIIESIDFANDLLEVVPYESFNTEDNNQKNKNTLLYGLNEICEITSKIFEDAKESNESVKFIFEVELDEDLINTVALTQQDLVNTNDLKIVKERFNQLAKILAIPLDSGFSYYWEIRKTWLKSYKKKFTGSATVHLCCTM